MFIMYSLKSETPIFAISTGRTFYGIPSVLISLDKPTDDQQLSFNDLFASVRDEALDIYKYIGSYNDRVELAKNTLVCIEISSIDISKDMESWIAFVEKINSNFKGTILVVDDTFDLSKVHDIWWHCHIQMNLFDDGREFNYDNIYNLTCVGGAEFILVSPSDKVEDTTPLLLSNVPELDGSLYVTSATMFDDEITYEKTALKYGVSIAISNNIGVIRY